MKIMRFSVKGQRRRRSRTSSGINAVLSLGLILFILSEACVLSSVAEAIKDGRLARKAGLFGPIKYHVVRTVLHHHVPSPSHDHDDKKKNCSEENSKLYEQENRLVHTGPNPLHN